jgi:hypothetical protein
LQEREPQGALMVTTDLANADLRLQLHYPTAKTGAWRPFSFVRIH